MTEALHDVHQLSHGVHLRPVFLELFDRGYTRAEAEAIQAAWYDTNVEDPCCAAEAEQYYLEGKD